MTPPPALPWYGFVRAGPRGPWRQVCEANSESACWAKLLAMRLSGDKLVSWKADPNGEERRR